jgi:hypothetical protein
MTHRGISRSVGCQNDDFTMTHRGIRVPLDYTISVEKCTLYKHSKTQQSNFDSSQDHSRKKLKISICTYYVPLPSTRFPNNTGDQAMRLLNLREGKDARTNRRGNYTTLSRLFVVASFCCTYILCAILVIFLHILFGNGHSMYLFTKLDFVLGLHRSCSS